MKRIRKERKVEEVKQKYMKTEEVKEEDKLGDQLEHEIKGNY
jgi:hypothetical protein